MIAIESIFPPDGYALASHISIDLWEMSCRPWPGGCDYIAIALATIHTILIVGSNRSRVAMPGRAPTEAERRSAFAANIGNTTDGRRLGQQGHLHKAMRQFPVEAEPPLRPADFLSRPVAMPHAGKQEYHAGRNERDLVGGLGLKDALASIDEHDGELRKGPSSLPAKTVEGRMLGWRVGRPPARSCRVRCRSCRYPSASPPR